MQSGGCLCGAVRWRYDGEIGPAAYCHCTDCRRCTGSAFNVSVRLRADGFSIVQGSPKSFTKAGDSGRPVTRAFCADCGSPLYTLPPLHPDLVFVKAGSFDDTEAVRPMHQSWTASAVRWARIPDELPSFAKNRS